jgi:hypothetical protein
MLAASASAAPARGLVSGSVEGLYTQVEYSGTWMHTYKGSPSGSAKNPGSETVTSSLKFTESVSLFAPLTALAPGGHGANSNESAVKVTLSGQTTIAYKGSNLTGCSATFTPHSGLKGDQWLVGGFGQPLAYISVNEQQTKGHVAVYAEAPGLRSSVHPEFVVHRTGGDASDNACDSGNMPIGEFPCNETPLITDPEYTPGDRGFNQPPYGFLHAVAMLDPHSPTYSHRYHVHKVLSSCDGADTVTADSLLIVNNSHANGAPPPPPTTTPTRPTGSPGLGKKRAKRLAQKDLEEILPEASFWCGQASLGVGSVTVGLAGVATAGIAVVGAQLFITDAAMCNALAGAIATDIRIIDDPPLGHIDQLAAVRLSEVRSRATGCPHWKGQPADFCANLNAARTSVVAGATRMSAVAEAVATTVGRESNALRQHKAAAAKRQDQHLQSLNVQEQAAFSAYLAASTRLGSLLHGAGFRIRMTPAQDARAIRALLARLAHAGVSESTLRRLAGDELEPRALDVLALLAGHITAPSAPSPSTPGPPTRSKPAIASVTFRGSPTDPTFVVHGESLGKQPPPNPAGHPAGLNGCPTVAGDNGYDYGTSLYLAVPAKNWAGGRYRPSLNETDCIDLVVTKFTSTEVDFHFGPFYAQYHNKFSLEKGDEVQVAVNGATKTVHVEYGATVSA